MAIINGTDGNNILGTNDANVVINGLGGDDLLTGGDGSVVLNGGDGKDTLIGGSGGGLLDGGDGDDLLIGGDGDVTILTGKGNNTVQTGDGNATIMLGDGENTIVAGDGNITVSGQGSGKTTVQLGGGDAVLLLGDGDDVVTAGGGNVTMLGGEGNDSIIGGDGQMVVDGGDGNDTIQLGAGGGVVTGGGGNNTYVFGPDGAGDTSLLDFDPEKDTIDLSQFPGAPTFGDDGEGGTTITVGGITITVPGVPPDEVEEATETNPDAPCFLRGTRILTAAGEVAVETLKVGDLVVTLDGTAKPVKWIGRRSHSARFISRVPSIEPVCFRAGSLGENMPSRDLYVSHDHAMFLDGVFVDASRLVNGTTVVRANPGCRTIEYFHVELDEHEVIFASNTPSESYANHGNRSMFQNAAEYSELYETDAVARELPYNCHERKHPTVYSGPRLIAIRERIARRAEELAAQAEPLALSA